MNRVEIKTNFAIAGSPRMAYCLQSVRTLTVVFGATARVSVERRKITVSGTVQGVGFRPFVYGLASRLSLGGFVKNRAGGVTIEIEGEDAPLDQFLNKLKNDSPPLAHIDQLIWQAQTPQGDKQFRIETSDVASLGPVAISPDIATCEQCLAELFDPSDRRYRYPFINCTNCGPRLTIVTAAPYDRDRTTMAGFEMCSACRAEYEDPTNRRFHAQPIACPICGPALGVLDSRNQRSPRIRRGKIAGREKSPPLKVLADIILPAPRRIPQAVSNLRKAKHRDEKPFAIMVRDVATANLYCRISRRRNEIALLAESANCADAETKWRQTGRGNRAGESVPGCHAALHTIASFADT